MEETFSRKVATVSDPNPQLGQEVSWVEVYGLEIETHANRPSSKHS